MTTGLFPPAPLAQTPQTSLSSSRPSVPAPLALLRPLLPSQLLREALNQPSKRSPQQLPRDRALSQDCCSCLQGLCRANEWCPSGWRLQPTPAYPHNSPERPAAVFWGQRSAAACPGKAERRKQLATRAGGSLEASLFSHPPALSSPSPAHRAGITHQGIPPQPCFSFSAQQQAPPSPPKKQAQQAVFSFLRPTPHQAYQTLDPS